MPVNIAGPTRHFNVQTTTERYIDVEKTLERSYASTVLAIRGIPRPSHPSIRKFEQ